MNRLINAVSNFEFPLGRSAENRWRPVTLTGTDGVSRMWTVEFIDKDPTTILGNTYKTGELVKTMNTFYYYDFHRKPATGTIDLKLWYEDGDFPSLNEDSLVIGHWDAGNTWWDNWGKNNWTTDWSRNTVFNWVKVDGISSFSHGGGGGGGHGGDPLPVELLHFDAKCDVDDVVLSWSTVSEVNNDYFTIERSIDGVDFEVILKLSAAGNSNQVLSYTAFDLEPHQKIISYYRLKQTDYDDQYEYLAMVAVNCKEKPDFIGQFTIDINSDIEQKIFVNIYDIYGKTCYQNALDVVKGNNKLEVELSEMSNSVYFIGVQSERNSVFSKLVLSRQ